MVHKPHQNNPGVSGDIFFHVLGRKAQRGSKLNRFLEHICPLELVRKNPPRSRQSSELETEGSAGFQMMNWHVLYVKKCSSTEFQRCSAEITMAEKLDRWLTANGQM